MGEEQGQDRQAQGADRLRALQGHEVEEAGR